MADRSKIEWTDATWSPVRGCVKISPGCKHCYAETFAERWRGIPGHAYEHGFDPRLAPEQLGLPLRWKRPRRVFVNSMSDLFFGGHRTDVVADAPFPFDYIAAVFGVMGLTPRHTYQILTKRPERAEEFLAWLAADPVARLAASLDERFGAEAGVFVANYINGWSRPREAADDGNPCDGTVKRWPLPNVLLGVSVEDRKYGVPRIDVLRRIPWGRRFLSIEPLLEDLGDLDLTGISWVIVGGESGPGARPFNVAWARRIIAQCREQSVPAFTKQLGAVVHDRNDAGFGEDDEDAWHVHPDAVVDVDPTQRHQGALVRIRLKDRKGGDPAEWPHDLRVRQFPEVA